jgi:hypothetical protein
MDLGADWTGLQMLLERVELPMRTRRSSLACALATTLFHQSVTLEVFRKVHYANRRAE